MWKISYASLIRILLIFLATSLSACQEGGLVINNDNKSSTFTVTVEVDGLEGKGLTLINNGGDHIPVNANGFYIFSTALEDGDNYKVEVTSQPSSPEQDCKVKNASGKVDGDDVTGIVVNCISYSAGNRTLEVAGTVTGLEVVPDASGFAIKNGTETLYITQNGDFTFGRHWATDDPYNVTITTQPVFPEQICRVLRGTGTLANDDVTNVWVNCESSYRVAGTVTGLVGTGLTLQNNGGDDLVINADGEFMFGTGLSAGDTYDISIASQPVDADQSCLVKNASGVIADLDIANVEVTCINNLSVTGKVSGMLGGTMVVEVAINTDADDSDEPITERLSVGTDGDIEISNTIPDGSTITVSVSDQPSGDNVPTQLCTVQNGDTLVSGSDISNVQISCQLSYELGGTVSGLNGVGLTLQNNGGDDLVITDNGSFIFPTTLLDVSPYKVTISGQPTQLSQTCTVVEGTGLGVIDSADVTDVQIECQTNSFTVGGSVTGANAPGLTLQNNGGDDIQVDADGAFSFPTALLDGSAFDVSVTAHPANQACTVSNGLRSLAGSDVTDITVTCFDPPHMTAAPLSTAVELDWNDVNALNYNVYYSTLPGFNPDDHAASPDVSQITGVGMPYQVPDLLDGTPYYFVVEAEYSNTKLRSEERGARPNHLAVVPKTIAVDANGNAYLGGDFTSVGAYTGAGIPLNIEDGTHISPDFSVVEGIVKTAIPDGAGGWYIGGDIERVGGLTRTNVAHIFADGKVDTNWSPSVNDQVWSLALIGDTVFIGGKFTKVNDEPHKYLAAIDSAGMPISSFDPSPDNYVLAMTVVDSTLYVGGYFTQIAGNNRSRVAALDSAGTLQPWLAEANGTVHALASDGVTIYIGGTFSTVKGQSRKKFAAVGVDGTLSALNFAVTAIPASDNIEGSIVGVRSIAVDGQTIYLAGDFIAINGTSRDLVAAVNTSGSVLPFVPDFGYGAKVFSVAVSNGKVYVGGRFSTVNNTLRERLAAFDSDGNLLPLAPPFNDNLYVIAIQGNKLYAGGLFSGAGGAERKYLAAIGPDGKLLPWNPGAGNVVHKMIIDGDTLYIGGDFMNIGGKGYRYVAAVKTDGTILPWNPDPVSSVYAIAKAGDIIYIGGMFWKVGVYDRDHLAAVDINGNVLPWNPSVDSIVNILEVSDLGDTIYAAGYFTTANGYGRNRLAAFDASGNLTQWFPNPDTLVNSMIVDGQDVYLGGLFNTVNGQGSNGLAKVDATTGQLKTWARVVFGYGSVATMTKLGDTIYVAGDFSDINGAARIFMASIHTDGTLGGWMPEPNSFVKLLYAAGDHIYMAGDFTFIDGDAHGGFAVTHEYDYDQWTYELQWP